MINGRIRDVSNEYKASAMYGLMSPTSPEKYRRETAWGYSQGAPPVFKGDLYYYSIDHDLTQTAEKIDATHTPLYLLTGEYDWATTPEMSEELAKRIKGAKYTTMRGLGHFPMSEDPAHFREYICRCCAKSNLAKRRSHHGNHHLSRSPRISRPKSASISRNRWMPKMSHRSSRRSGVMRC